MSPEATIAIRVQPRARRNEIAGVREDVIVVRVVAPPADGRANDAVCRLIAKRAGVPRSRVTIIKGSAARDKLVRVHGVGERDLRRALAP